MARPKSPKKSSDAKEIVSTDSNSQPLSDVNTVPAESSAAVTVTETRTTEARKTARKPEIVRTEPRANLFPINMDDEIRRLAYLLSERRGFEVGHETEDWFAAEREIRQRYHQQSA